MKFPLQCGLVLLSACMLPLCFPPFDWWPLLIPVFSLLFIATTNTSSRRTFFLGFFHGLLGYGFSLYWLFNLFGPAAIPLYAILAWFTGFFCLLFNFYTKQTKSATIKVLLAATLWTAIEFYRAELFFLRFPWITPGTAMGPTFLSPILGVYGTSFLVVAASAAFIYRKTLPYAIILSICILCLGIIRPGLVEPDEKGSIVATVVQSEECYLRPYIEMTKTAEQDSPDLIVWPEYSLPYDVRKNPDDFAKLKDLCAEMDAVLVVGTKTILGPGDTNWRNTALTIDKNGVVGEYYKTRPVHFFNDGIPGNDFNPIKTEFGSLATPICFDCDYSEVSRKMVSNGAEYFAAPSFDAESWSANQHLQHSLLFRLRAVENGRWFACAASSGVSQIIDPHGNVHKSIPPMKTGAITSRIGKNTHKTFFVRIGWLFPWLTFCCLMILLAYGAVIIVKGKKNTPIAPESQQTNQESSE